MKKTFLITLSLLLTLTLSACGSSEAPEKTEVLDKQLNQIMAAKTRFALAKTAAPVFNTHDWDLILGGLDGTELKYDRFGEVDELVFVALPGTFFQVQRQIRKETRSGKETIYYKVTTPDYKGTENLWIDGRFLDLRDVQPENDREPASLAKTLITLRRLEGSPYTWHGSSLDGVPDLLRYYPPKTELTFRESADWEMKGFDSLGMLYYASNGSTPLDAESLARFGQPIHVDFSTLTIDEENDDPNALRLKKAQKLMTILRPLDIIQMNDRVWIVLDQSDVIESRYRSKFDGDVQISSLLDTLFGLFQKGVYVKNPFEELEDPLAKKFFIRRYADTSELFLEQLTEELESDSDIEPEADPDAEIISEDEEDRTLEPVLFTIDKGETGEAAE